MHNHFDTHLKLKDIILERKPSLIVECGAGSGENTRQILSLKKNYKFQLVTINDSPYAEEIMKLGDYLKNGFRWVYGLSYNVFSDFEDQSIGLCIIDTDHNYWTMNKELEGVHPKIKPGGLIALHDTETYRKNSGQANRYGTGDPYPGNLISKHEKEGKGMGDAIFEFIAGHTDYIVLKQVRESHGAMLLEKFNA